MVGGDFIKNQGFCGIYSKGLPPRFHRSEWCFFEIFLVCGNFEEKGILKLHSHRLSFTFLFTRVLNDATPPYVASNWAIIGVCASNTKI